MGFRGKPRAAAERRFYEQAADILRRLEARQGSIKTLTIGNGSVKPENKRKVYALICQTLKYSSVLARVLERCAIADLATVDRRVALLLAHDLLLTRAGLQRAGADEKLNRQIARHKARLRSELDRIKQEVGAASDEDLVPAALRDELPTFRYVRVNLLAATVDGVVGQFEKEGYRLAAADAADRSQLHAVLAAGSRTFMRDPDLHDVLAFPPGTDLHAHPLFVDGSIVLQDKASCMPAHVVQPPPGSTALDSCAAPGNKTSHMASLMANRGRIFAFDKDRARLNTLVRLTDQAHSKIITARCASFLDIDPLDPQYAAVEYALLDPSCSGSGIVNRMDALVDAYIAGIGRGASGKGGDEDKSGDDTKAHEVRLQRLAEFQTSIVLHAMRFPGVKRISYSTCSVHVEENEAVVARVLRSQGEFSLAPADQVIPTWPRRGLETAGLTEAQAASLVRALPEDGTNGFFVAGFVRTAPADPSRAAAAAAAMPAPPASNNTGRSLGRSKRGGRDRRQRDAATASDDGPAKRPRVAAAATDAPKSRGKKRPRRKVAVAVAR
ncbi:hypothetical protein LPJ61_002517 [Coemansia biformis]|uniref:SAM-dependent MTase RsmB/NOP-type domain-containing protein n=1 Tax=Coemansia biformis TaxID=1286918 RepID=A0A9W8CZ42_9FUNG|nr:hypothetical protein LPJ61_002517 [Coemansia biformis]